MASTLIITTARTRTAPAGEEQRARLFAAEMALPPFAHLAGPGPRGRLPLSVSQAGENLAVRRRCPML